MTETEISLEIDGAADLISYFGYWPSFHDGEVLRLELNRTGESYLYLHAFEMTAQVSESGHFVLDHHVTVRFILDGVVGLQLDAFNGQNVISGLDLQIVEGGIQVALGGCYGLEGTITATRIRVDFEEGIPTGSSYNSANVLPH